MTNLRENRFFGEEGEVVDKKGSHCVKNYTEKWTKKRGGSRWVNELQAFGLIKLAGVVYLI